MPKGKRIVEYRPKEQSLENYARLMVRSAVRSGELKQEPCDICGARITVAHHDNYYKPLRVRWLCVSHHNQHHADERRARK